MRPTGVAFTEDEIRVWLIEYAWAGDMDENVRMVTCIMAQDGWKYIDGRTEHYSSQAEDPGPEAWKDAHGFALSSLYECHDEPHLPDCPDNRS